MPALRPPPAPPPWAESLLTVGVTGTNGKTSTTALVAALLSVLAEPVARVTTVGSFLADERLDVPGHYDGFLETMRRCVAAGGKYAAVEFTSEALAAGFAKAWPCCAAVFTNLSLDHLDAHGSPEHYLASKAQLFMALQPGTCAVLNGRDSAAALIGEVMPRAVEVLRYGVASRGEAWAELHLEARAVRVNLRGTEFEFEPSARFPDLPRSASIRAIGQIFVENALGALAAALAVGVPAEAALGALARAAPPPGRFQVLHERPCVVVDYAHTPDALSRTLTTARALCTGRVSVVFGAGGERDRSDRVWLTSDNPRSEDPQLISEQIAAGLVGHANVRCELDRARAIASAIAEAGSDDVVLIAGKGHEREQHAGGQRLPFSDEAIVRTVCGSDTHETW